MLMWLNYGKNIRTQTKHIDTGSAVICFPYNRKMYLPHSGGNGSLGDLLSVNSVPRINPVPRICKIT